VPKNISSVAKKYIPSCPISYPFIYYIYLMAALKRRRSKARRTILKGREKRKKFN
jgi:hypothetical protein